MQQFYGFIPSKRDIRDYKLNKKIHKVINVPASFNVKTTRIKNQGQVGSCVAHSVSSVIEHTDLINYSTDWIYGYRPFGYFQGYGMSVSDALKTVTKLGAVRYVDLPTNTEMPKVKEIVNSKLETYKAAAASKRAFKYARLYGTQQIKEAIYTSKHPVILCIGIGSEGLRLDENNIAFIPKDNIGGHAVMCYGWNESGLLIQNSWGQAWGDKGCFILPYEYPLLEAWALSFTNDNIIVKPSCYDLREFIINLGRTLISFVKGWFKNKDEKEA